MICNHLKLFYQANRLWTLVVSQVTRYHPCSPPARWLQDCPGTTSRPGSNCVDFSHGLDHCLVKGGWGGGGWCLKGARALQYLQTFCNTFRFSAMPADFLEHSTDFMQYLQISATLRNFCGASSDDINSITAQGSSVQSFYFRSG